MKRSGLKEVSGKVYAGFIIAISCLLFSENPVTLVVVTAISVLVIALEILLVETDSPTLSKNLQNFEKFSIAVASLFVIASILLIGKRNISLFPVHLISPGGVRPSKVPAGVPVPHSFWPVFAYLILPLVSLCGLLIAYLGVKK